MSNASLEAVVSPVKFGAEAIRGQVAAVEARRKREREQELAAFNRYLDDLKAIRARCSHENQKQERDDIDTPLVYMTHLKITCLDCGKVLR